MEYEGSGRPKTSNPNCTCWRCEYNRKLEEQQEQHASTVFDEMADRWASQGFVKPLPRGLFGYQMPAFVGGSLGPSANVPNN